MIMPWLSLVLYILDWVPKQSECITSRISLANWKNSQSAEPHKWPGNSVYQKRELNEQVLKKEVWYIYTPILGVIEAFCRCDNLFKLIPGWSDPEERNTPEQLREADELLDEECETWQKLIGDSGFCARMREKAIEWAQRTGIEVLSFFWCLQNLAYEFAWEGI